MGFELSVKSNTPLVGESDKDEIARMFLENIGYITKGSEPDIPLKLFMDCFGYETDPAVGMCRGVGFFIIDW